VLGCLAAAGEIYWHTQSAATSAQRAQSIPVAVTIDLSQAGTTRGTDTSAVPAVVLPRRVDTAHVILPNFSPGGNYVVSVTTDRNGGSEKATGRAVANVLGFHADLTVALDLRSLPPGTYFLATTHEGDPASYFYPLTVR
jgi:phage-related protein